jgi:ABC-type lipoprotein export system ATPase subunit
MTQVLLQAKGLRLKGFSNADSWDFQIQASECWWVTGARGSGKSAMIKTLLGQVPAVAGELLWKGQSVYRMSAREVRNSRPFLGAVIDGGGLIPAWTAHANLMLGLRLKELSVEQSAQAIDAFAAQFGIPKDWFGKAAAALSADQGALMALARAALRQPEVLLIDSDVLVAALLKGGTGMAGVLPWLLQRGCALLVSSPTQPDALEKLLPCEVQARSICMNNGSMHYVSEPHV